eukprot:4292463-Pleurochrysis_carterae.AAC.1
MASVPYHKRRGEGVGGAWAAQNALDLSPCTPVTPSVQSRGRSQASDVQVSSKMWSVAAWSHEAQRGGLGRVRAHGC